MRTTRIIAVLGALALALATLTITTTTSSGAVGAQAKTRHIGVAHGKEIRNTNKFVAFGKWETYKGRTITVQRKDCRKCAWKAYKKIKTRKSDGHFRTGIAAGKKVPSRVCYRVNVPPTKRYKRTIDSVGCIETKRF